MTAPRVLALLALLAVGVLLTVARLNTPTGDEPVRDQALAFDEPEITAADLPVLRSAPDLVEIDGWLQSDTETLSDLRGKVVILQFWTFSCRNCKATIPNLQEIYERYDREQVEIVGVHAPEFGFEEDPGAILKAAADLGVTWPIALDTKKRNFHSWQEGRTAYWPRTYVIDPQGQIRFDHIGEGKHQDLQDAVAALVAEL